MKRRFRSRPRMPRHLMRHCAAIIAAVALLTMAVAGLAQEPRSVEIRIINPSGPEPALPPQLFSQEQLDQMLAPIALYPDELLVQVLMAATYPMEVVEAARWVQAYPGLSGDQLAIALEQQDWDPSVKSLVNFPIVLQMMNDNLGWTQQLGDAFLSQEEQVMATVQQLRLRAQAQGSLISTSEQKVIVDPQTGEIVIVPVVTEVVYVPIYDPTIVYGPWWWPRHRPFYYHPRGVVIPRGAARFGIGVTIGVPWGYAWGGFDWHRHNVVINVERNVRINNHIDRNRYVSHVTVGGRERGTWRHDPVHRQGIAYRSPAVAQQYGRGPRPGSDTRRDFRGFEQRPSTAPQARTEPPPRPPAPPAQQSRVASPPSVARPEPPRPPAPPVQQTPAAPAPSVATPQPARPSSPPAQQQRVAPVPVAARAERARPPASTSHAAQGVQGPTPFGGPSPAAQTRQFSNRGHESLGMRPPSGQAPTMRPLPQGGGRGAPEAAPHGAPPHGSPATGNAGGGAPQGGRGGPHGGR